MGAGDKGQLCNEISLRGLPKGLYWLRVTAPGFSADRRIALL